MNRARQLAQRARGKYLKPEPPDGPFVIVGPNAEQSGPTWAHNFVPTTLPGEPWGLPGGSPRIYRIKKQVGNRIFCEDGDYYFKPIELKLRRAAA